MEEKPTECLICCNEIDILGIGKDCHHEAHTCWKCAYIIQQYNKEKVCPLCKNTLKVVKYVDVQTYSTKELSDIEFIHMTDKELKATNIKVKDEEQIEALYENEAVKKYIFHCTAPYCYQCDKEFRLYIEYKKHVEIVHRSYICELCLKNRHCVLSDLQVFETKGDLKKHLNGRYEDSYMNHKKCSLCGTYHDDDVALKHHYREEHRICEFCEKKKNKKDSDYVFADYRAFMNHAKVNHLICNMNGCDCVFKDAMALDLHQAEYHQKKVSLRMQHRDDDGQEEEEEKKVPTITPQQYERMNKDRKNEHFPTLSASDRVYVPVEESKKKGKKNKNGKTEEQVNNGTAPSENFPSLPGGEPPRSKITRGNYK